MIFLEKTFQENENRLSFVSALLFDLQEGMRKRLRAKEKSRGGNFQGVMRGDSET